MDRIKELLREWAGYFQDGYGIGFPKQAAFASERVQNDNRDTASIRDIPDVIVQLNNYIEDVLAQELKQVIQKEYKERGPQKAKAHAIGIPRQVYTQRLYLAHSQLVTLMSSNIDMSKYCYAD